MNRLPDPLIDRLVADLAPVAPMRPLPAIARTLAATALAVLVVAATLGLRRQVTPLFLLSAGLFLVLGLAAAITVIGMARPRVGSDRTGWLWAAAMTALLPLSTGLMAVAHAHSAWALSDPATGVLCLGLGLLCGLGTAGVLVLWLRRGAPSSPAEAGLLTGVAAGGLGMFAVALHCPDDAIYHIGLWHSAPVLAGAALGRLLVPRLVRW